MPQPLVRGRPDLILRAPGTWLTRGGRMVYLRHRADHLSSDGTGTIYFGTMPQGDDEDAVQPRMVDYDEAGRPVMIYWGKQIQDRKAYEQFANPHDPPWDSFDIVSTWMLRFRPPWRGAATRGLRLEVGRAYQARNGRMGIVNNYPGTPKKNYHVEYVSRASTEPQIYKMCAPNGRCIESSRAGPLDLVALWGYAPTRLRRVK